MTETTPINCVGAHQWAPSSLGHGNTMCLNCLTTDLEAAALGIMNECSAAPTPPVGSDTIKCNLDCANYEGAMADLDSAITVLIRRINGDADLASAAEWVRLNYPKRAVEILSAVALQTLATPGSEPPSSLPIPAGGGDAVAWQVKDWADGWICFDDEARARAESQIMGNATVRALALQSDLDAARERVRELEAGIAGIDADYMTSEAHHPGHVLIPVARFEALRALSNPVTEGEG